MKRACCHPRSKPGFWALIEIVVVLAIILVGISLYFGLSGSRNRAERELLDPTGTTVATNLQKQLEAGGSGRPGPEGRPATEAEGNTAADGAANQASVPNVRQPTTIPGRAISKARGEQCMENLRQLRMLIQLATDDRGGVFPTSLTDVPDSIQVRSCPIGGQDYAYDPDSGKVSCTTPGHEGF